MKNQIGFVSISIKKEVTTTKQQSRPLFHHRRTKRVLVTTHSTETIQPFDALLHQHPQKT
jgi:hypothetical protein